MSNIQNQKSGLAKLMATENLTVQHAKTQTASFDPKNRILTCPIWSEMSGDLYDLLMGHEVGHAIDTPADGWHGAVHDRGANYKGFLNVVEDARIEKRQKRRYPGLRRSFVNGFGELMKRDFFGIGDREVNTFPFIDRLNLYTKSGYTMPIAFNSTEQDFVDRVQACETWEDVLKVTEEIWDYSKEEQSQINMPQDSFDFSDEDADGEQKTGANEGDAETEAKGNNKSKASDEGDDGDQEKESQSSSGDNQENGDDEDGESGGAINRFKDSQSIREHMEPRCETDENFRRNESSLIDKKAREYVYANIPQANLKNIITPAKRVQEILTKEFSDQRKDYESIANTLYNDFRRKNERFISLLAKEFEMRKAADKFAKAKTSDTGDIDVSRIFKYQIDDAIFKKVMRVPKGKSHGLILLLDKSGSMSENLAASYEQILILAMFCRKVNIPFAAYGFGNSTGVHDLDFPNRSTLAEDYSYNCFTTGNKELCLSEVFLREMINSKMSNSEFSKAVKNVLCLMDAYSGRSRYSYSGLNFYRPASDSLSNTPLTEALIACQPLINEFRKVNNLDIVNMCVVHDGDADNVHSYYDTSVTQKGRNFLNTNYQNVFLVDKKAKVQQEVSGIDDGLRIAVAKWLSKTTGVKIIGFYLTPHHAIKSALRHRLYNDEVNALRDDATKRYDLFDLIGKYQKIMKKEKFLESKNDGYESFFFIPGGSELSVDDEEFEAPTKVTTATLTKAFSKYTKSRQVNRVLVSRFIGMIAV